MSREYAIIAENVTLAGASTLIFLHPGTTNSLEVLRMWIAQSANVTSAQQRVEVVSQVSAFPTLTSFTPTKLKPGDPASAITGGTAGAAGTCGINASAEGAGSKSVILADAFNVINGWLWVPTPQERLILPASWASGLGLYFPATPGTLTNWHAGLIYKEIG
jgi:hypothetical protein